MLRGECRISGPIPGSHDTAMKESQLKHDGWETGWLDLMYKGHLGDTGIRLDNRCTLLDALLYAFFFNHIYHSAILITFESAV
jgi:hypothetical protein